MKHVIFKWLLTWYTVASQLSLSWLSVGSTVGSQLALDFLHKIIELVAKALPLIMKYISLFSVEFTNTRENCSAN